MKDVKRRMEFFSTYDRDSIAAHLEAMAARGWQLESMGKYLWTYRRAEPRSMHYAVTYYDASSWDWVEPTGDMAEFYEMCEHQGWQSAARYGGMQVFLSELDDPVPLETDAVVELSAVHKEAKRRIVAGCGIIAVIGAVALAVLLRAMSTDPLGTLSNFWAAQVGLYFVLFGLVSLGKLIYYYIWRSAAAKAVETGARADTRALSRAARAFDVCVIVLTALFIVSLLSLRTFPAMELGLKILGLVVTLMAAGLVQNLLESAGRSRRLSFAVSLVVLIVMSAAMAAGEFFIADKYAMYSEEDLKLTLAAITGEDVPTYGYGNEQESFLLARLSVTEAEIYGQTGEVSDVRLEYDVDLVRIPALYGFCENFAARGGEEIDPAPWVALRAYQTGENSYVLCYADRIVEITLPFAPTPEQCALVGEKLGT